jgi:parvulin-like peptidyl-prolyl isomerase
MGLRVLDDMVDQALIEQYAAANGLTVTDEQIEQKINDVIGYDPEAVALIGAEPTATTEPTSTPTPFVSPTPTTEPTATPEPTATATLEGGITATPTVTPVATATAEPTRTADEVREDFEQRKRSLVSEVAQQANVSEQTVREYFRYLALQDVIAETLDEGSTEETTLYADSRHILVETEEAANDVLQALQAGESFAELAKAVSTDTGSGANGGELGWTAVSNYVTEFADAVKDAPIGEIVGPVETEFGFHIIQVRAREQRDATEAEIERARRIAFDTWLEAYREENQTAGNFETTDAWLSNVPTSPVFVYRER